MPTRGALKVEPLWARVDANRVKLSVFVAFFVVGSACLLEAALVVLPGALFSLLATDTKAYFDGLTVVVAGSFGVLLASGALIAAIQLANAEDWVRARFKGRDLEAGEYPALASAVTDMALAAGLAEAPRIVVLEAPGDSVNAVAVGTTRARPLIGITPGFLSRLTVDEKRAVVATMIARIVAGDIMFGTALAALMGPIKAVRGSFGLLGSAGSAASDAGCSARPSGSGCGDPGCADSGCMDGCGGCASVDDLDASGCGGVIAVAVFVAIVALLTYLAVVTASWIVTLWGRALHRTAYEKADAEGMLLLKDPSAMLSALAKTAHSSNRVADGDSSYDGIFYVPTSGAPKVERVERRRYGRLREVLGTEGIAAAELDNWARQGNQPTEGREPASE